MSLNTVTLAIKAALDADTNIKNLVKNIRIADVMPENISDSEIVIYGRDYDLRYLDEEEQLYPVFYYPFNIYISNLKPNISPALDTSEDLRLYYLVDLVINLFNSNTLGGILLGDGTKLLSGGLLTDEKAPLNHRFAVNFLAPYADESDFQNIFVGPGYLYVGDSPSSALAYNQINWTQIETCRTPMSGIERQRTGGTDDSNFAYFDGTEMPKAPTGIQIQTIFPVFSGYFKEITSDTLSYALCRSKSGTKVYRSRSDETTSPFITSEVKAWKYEITMPWGAKLIEFIPSGVMMISEENERAYREGKIVKLEFSLYPKENPNYAKEERLGYIITLSS